MKRIKNNKKLERTMNKTTISLILGVVFLFVMISGVSALDSLGTYKQNNDVRITQVCSDATYINISSISYPNGTIAVSGIEMTSAGSGEYYYDFNQTSALGKYHVRGISDGCEETFATYFEVTQTGIQEKNLYTIFISIAIAIAISFFIMSFIFDEKLFMFSAIAFIGSGVMIFNFPFGSETPFIMEALSLLLSGAGLLILGVYVIKDWFDT